MQPIFKTVLSVFALSTTVFMAPQIKAQEASFRVTTGQVEDRKAVFATVESVDVVSARARIGGTVTELLVDEGSPVEAGQKLPVWWMKNWLFRRVRSMPKFSL